MNSVQSRRQFLQQSALIAGSAALAGCSAPYVSRRRVLGSNDRLNIACVAVGGKGWVDMNGCDSENLVGLCDVDAKNLAKAGKSFRRRNVTPTTGRCSTNSAAASTP